MKPYDLILIGGLPQHGKSTLAAFISERLGWKYGNTSDAIYDELARRRSVSVATLQREPKEQLRPDLIATGDELCASDPAALIQLQAAAGVRVIAGVRKPDELEAARQRFRALFVWVTRPDFKSPPDNTLLTAVDADLHVVNRSLHTLRAVAGLVSGKVLGQQHPGASLWALLHRYAASEARSGDVTQRQRFLDTFDAMLGLCLPDCPCQQHWREVLGRVPPPALSQDFYTWTLVLHDVINHRRGVPRFWSWTELSPYWLPLLGTAEPAPASASPALCCS